MRKLRPGGGRGRRLKSAQRRLSLWLVALEDIVLLNQSIQTYNVFPREFFASDADWQAFLDQVRQHVPAKAPKSLRGTDHTLALWMVIFVVVLLLYNLVRSR